MVFEWSHVKHDQFTILVQSSVQQHQTKHAVGFWWVRVSRLNDLICGTLWHAFNWDFVVMLINLGGSWFIYLLLTILVWQEPASKTFVEQSWILILILTYFGLWCSLWIFIFPINILWMTGILIVFAIITFSAWWKDFQPLRWVRLYAIYEPADGLGARPSRFDLARFSQREGAIIHELLSQHELPCDE